MPRGDKSAYTDKQKRQAEHIEESERERGASEGTAERIAWATVNKQDGGGKRSGSVRKVRYKEGHTQDGSEEGGGKEGTGSQDSHKEGHKEGDKEDGGQEDQHSRLA
uniref:Plasmid stabilization protein n=1 Tax=Panagrolaimus superbus TaxID=310955 RepID=A0A914YAB8_9BILA